MSEYTILAVDLGGTKIAVGEINRKGEILSERRFDSVVTSQKEAIEGIIKAIELFMKDSVIQGNVIAISVDVVGRVNVDNGIWYEIHPELADSTQLTQLITEKFQLPAFAINDVSAAALAEKEMGLGKEVQDFVYLNVGTGIAGRIISDNQMIRGAHFNAGEVGHMVVAMENDSPCICGRKGCVESFASGLGMSNEVHRLRGQYDSTCLEMHVSERLSVPEILSAYNKEDELAMQVIENATQGIAELIMNMVRVSDPKAVVIGGGVMENDQLFELVLSKINKKTVRFLEKGIVRTKLSPSKIALIGCGLHGFLSYEKNLLKESSNV